MDELSPEVTSGQRLMAGFDGTRLNDQLRFLIKDIRVGGIILFSRNVITPKQVATLCHEAQDYAASCGLPPLFIAIDQEGGKVARLKAPFTEFPGNPGISCEADAIYFAKTTATELGSVGINMNMAPVLDIAPDGIESIMAARSFGPDPEWVSRMGCTVIRHLQENGIISVGKHFPGIGRTVLDSHIEMPILDEELSSLEKLELIPFKDAIAKGVEGIMLSHIFYPKIDSRWPASLSSEIALKLLRKRLNFSGLVLTDDLDMGAIERQFDLNTALTRILEAEIDLVLICHFSRKIQEAFFHILRFCEESEANNRKACRSTKRILLLKSRYLAGKASDHPFPVGPGKDIVI